MIDDAAGALYSHGLTLVDVHLLDLAVGLQDLRVRSGLRATRLERGLDRLLGVLLVVEVDRELDVEPVERRHVLDQANRAVGGIDLEDLAPPGSVQHRFHALLDAELSDPFVEQVTRRLEVVVPLVLGDRAHVADDVSRVRRVGVHPLPLGEDVQAGEVLGAFEQRRRRGLVDPLLDRHREERAVDLGLEATLHVLDRDVDPRRQAPEDLEPVGPAAQLLPVDGDGEHALVVGEDAPVDVEDAPPFRAGSGRCACGRSSRAPATRRP